MKYLLYKRSDVILCVIITKHIRVFNIVYSAVALRGRVVDEASEAKKSINSVNKCEMIMSRAWSINRVGVRRSLCIRLRMRQTHIACQSRVRSGSGRRGAEVSQRSLLNYSNQLTRHGAVNPLVLRLDSPMNDVAYFIKLQYTIFIHYFGWPTTLVINLNCQRYLE